MTLVTGEMSENFIKLKAVNCFSCAFGALLSLRLKQGYPFTRNLIFQFQSIRRTSIPDALAKSCSGDFLNVE